MTHASRDRVQAMTLPALAGTTIVDARYRRQRFAPHSHPTYVVALITDGVLAFRCGSRTWRAPAGSLCLLNPDEIQTGEPESDDGWAYRSAYIPIELFEGMGDLGEAAHAPDFRSKVVSDDGSREAAFDFFRASQSGCSTLGESELALSSLSFLTERHRDGARPIGRMVEPRLVTRAQEFLDANLAANVSLADVSTAVGVTGFHLTRLFKQSTGLSLHAWLVQRRTRQAFDLLRQGDLQAADVALACGFSDQPHMARWLRRLVGMTPKEVQAMSISFKRSTRKAS